MNYELVIFDWDGTLMDSTRVIASSLQAACSDVGIKVPSERDARYVIGLGLGDSFNHVAPGLDADARQRLTERYRHHFLAREDEMPLYEGVREMLADLHGRGRRLARRGPGSIACSIPRGCGPGSRPRAAPTRDSRNRTPTCSSC